MLIKRTTSLFLSLFFVLSISACHDKPETDTSEERFTNNFIEETRNVTSDNFTKAATEYVDDSDNSFSTEFENEIFSSNTTLSTYDDPTNWSTEQIVDVYKNAAQKSNSSVKSQQNIELKEISVNNGEYEGLFDFITPIISKLLANNSEDKDGITGGYNNLTAADVASAKAYRVGNNIAVEMVMQEQISGAYDDALDGTVGHAITTVGDISAVTKQLDDLGLPLEISEKDTKIYYTNPIVKVLINNNGEIINGTWSYTVEISLNNYKAFGKKVDTTSVVMDNTIMLNGGFKK